MQTPPLLASDKINDLYKIHFFSISFSNFTFYFLNWVKKEIDKGRGEELMKFHKYANAYRVGHVQLC